MEKRGTWDPSAGLTPVKERRKEGVDRKGLRQHTVPQRLGQAGRDPEQWHLGGESGLAQKWAFVAPATQSWAGSSPQAVPCHTASVGGPERSSRGHQLSVLPPAAPHHRRSAWCLVTATTTGCPLVPKQERTTHGDIPLGCQVGAEY